MGTLDFFFCGGQTTTLRSYCADNNCTMKYSAGKRYSADICCAEIQCQKMLSRSTAVLLKFRWSCWNCCSARGCAENYHVGNYCWKLCWSLVFKITFLQTIFFLSHELHYIWCNLLSWKPICWILFWSLLKLKDIKLEKIAKLSAIR